MSPSTLSALVTTLAIAAVQPASAQTFNETVGFISENLTAADGLQALTPKGECSATFRIHLQLSYDFHLGDLSKSSLRLFSENDTSASVVVNGNYPQKWKIEIQCFDKDCFAGKGEFSRPSRKIEMKVIHSQSDSLMKAWGHLLNQCNAKERKKLF